MFGKAAKTQELLRELLRDVNCPISTRLETRERFCVQFGRAP